MGAEVVRLSDVRANRLAQARAARVYNRLHKRWLGAVALCAAHEVYWAPRIDRLATKVIEDYGHLDDPRVDQVLAGLMEVKREMRALHAETANKYFELFPTSDMMHRNALEVLERLVARSER